MKNLAYILPVMLFGFGSLITNETRLVLGSILVGIFVLSIQINEIKDYIRKQKKDEIK